MFAKIANAAQAAGLIFPEGILDALDASQVAGVNAFLLEGEPGTGKTHLGRAWAEMTGGNYVFAQANAWTSDESIIRGVDLSGFIERDPAKVYAAGALLKAARLAVDGRPTLVHLDEWDKTRPVADGLLLAALEERIVVDSAGNIHGRFDDNVIFWITSNATRPLHDALLRRLMRITLPRMSKTHATPLLQERAGVGQHTASALLALREKSRRPVTLPDLIRIGRTLQHVRTLDGARVIIAGLTGDDKFGADIWAAMGRDGKLPQRSEHKPLRATFEGDEFPEPLNAVCQAFSDAMGV
ncbi:MAG: AAA family ATPase [Caldilineaceae bacterium]|nr:AAA family ATPase [Caldilineaceae bacterium]